MADKKILLTVSFLAAVTLTFCLGSIAVAVEDTPLPDVRIISQGAMRGLTFPSG